MLRTAFRDCVVILTGASQGIGREMALQLADQGARLVLAARTHNKLEQVAEACRDRGAEATAVPTDVTDRLACEMLVRRAVADFEAIDMLINNAGISVVATLADLETLDLPEQVMAVNYLGSLYCTYYALPHLRRSKGRIVAVSSLSGRAGVPMRSIYAASKHAVMGWQRSSPSNRMRRDHWAVSNDGKHDDENYLYHLHACAVHRGIGACPAAW